MSAAPDDFVDPDDRRFAALTRAIADRNEVDWAEAESTARNPEDRKFMGQLRRIARLAQFFREQGDEDPQVGLTAPTVDVPQTLPSRAAELNGRAVRELKSWRHLRI